MNKQLQQNQPQQRSIYIPPAGPPQERPPNVYAAMGEENIFAMLADFYRELENSSLRSMFPRDMERASRKSAAFFVGILGGPPLYHQRYGNPAMRARHMPFAIDEEGKEVWMRCFNTVLDRAADAYNFPPEHIPQFRAFLADFAGWMVNTATAASVDATAVDTGSDAGSSEQQIDPMLSSDLGIPLSTAIKTSRQQQP